MTVILAHEVSVRMYVKNDFTTVAAVDDDSHCSNIGTTHCPNVLIELKKEDIGNRSNYGYTVMRLFYLNSSPTSGICLSFKYNSNLLSTEVEQLRAKVGQKIL